MRTQEKLEIERAIVAIGESLNFEKFTNWKDFNLAIREKDTATEDGDQVTAARKLKTAKKLKSRAAEIADIIDALNEFDRLFHRTF